MKKLISLLMTIAVLLSVLQPAWAIEEAAEIDAVAASRNLIVVVPGIVGSELVDGNGTKVWVGVGGILGQIQCNEVGNPVYPLYAYNNDNYGARDTYKTLYDRGVWPLSAITHRSGSVRRSRRKSVAASAGAVPLRSSFKKVTTFRGKLLEMGTT